MTLLRDAQVEPVTQLLTSVIEEARQAGREDLIDHLETQRSRLANESCHVLVVGEFKKGKSALVNALVGVPVCSVDPVRSTAVPTVVRHGSTPSAAIVAASLDGEEPGARTAIAVRDAQSYALAGFDGTGAKIGALEVELPRSLLAEGIVLVDTPGVGGGFAASHAAATLRAMSVADAVVLVSDVSQEYTAPEVEFIQRMAALCPNMLGVLTKTDLYPDWGRIVDLDRRHLRQAGLHIELVPVSCTLREMALTVGDTALNNESGFPALVDRIVNGLAARQLARLADAAVTSARSALQQVTANLSTEQAALSGGSTRSIAAGIEQAEQKADRLIASGARWQHILQDGFAEAQSDLDADLAERIRRLRQEATERVRSSDPTRNWADLEPWLYERTNRDLAEHHTSMLDKVRGIALDVAADFGLAAVELDLAGGALRAGRKGAEPAMDALATARAPWLEVTMHAARGWSLSTSVMTTIIVTTLQPWTVVALPIMAVLGAAFAVRSVRTFRQSQLTNARNEAIRLVGVYLDQARADAARATSDSLRRGRQRIRDHFLERANELREGVRRDREATARAAMIDRSEATARAAETAASIRRLRALAGAADDLTGRPVLEPGRGPTGSPR